MKPKLLEATLGGGRLPKPKSSVLMVAAFGAAGLYGHQCVRCSSL